ncbi:hypothetical protein J4E93_008138 [Alternaria ventricosa]|uniref:uncharacterized protein n=1 Tax=Alternaria ventricosa TaxID=1187951 RepID=UPI0020C1CE77|nr:uncharacterized protein J4E93_008138 [Alternaria ventricosa]KAI4641259.1 hypothetical protein J4E93_008138 [Alternaria ventricosa]
MVAPAPLAVKQWYTIFTRGGAIARPLAAISALATGYLAYHRTSYSISISLPTPMPPLQSQATHEQYITNNPTEDRTSTPFRLNALATLLLPSIVPFTILVLGPTNNKLMAKKDELANASLRDKHVEQFAKEGETVKELMDKWASLNLARALLVGVGAVCAVAAGVVGRREVKEIGRFAGWGR